jgi:hypothetical protein
MTFCLAVTGVRNFIAGAAGVVLETLRQQTIFSVPGCSIFSDNALQGPSKHDLIAYYQPNYQTLFIEARCDAWLLIVPLPAR